MIAGRFAIETSKLSPLSPGSRLDSLVRSARRRFQSPLSVACPTPGGRAAFAGMRHTFVLLHETTPRCSCATAKRLFSLGQRGENSACGELCQPIHFRASGIVRMDFDLTTLIAYVRDNPFAAAGCLLGFALVLYLLRRKPSIQRDADQNLDALRKANAGRYDRLRSLE